MSDEVIIRPAVDSDYEAMIDLLNNFVNEDRYSRRDNDSFQAVLKQLNSFIYVVEVDGQPIGFASFSVRRVMRYPKPIAELEELFVAVTFRGRKIGSRLIQTCIDKAKELDCYRMYIESQYQHEGAHKLYESMGFTNYGYHFKKEL